MLIWRGGYSRTGNKMVLGLFDALIDASGRRATPLLSDDLTPGFLAERYDPAETYVGGADGVFAPVFRSHPDFRIVFVLRDLRDAMASLRRISHFDADGGLSWIKESMTLTDLYMALPDSVCLKLRYETDILDTAALTRTIADFLGIAVDQAAAERIGSMFQRDNVRRFVDRFQAEFFAKFEPYRTKPEGDGSEHTQFPMHRGDEVIWYFVPREATAFNEDSSVLMVDLTAFGGPGAHKFRRNMDGSFRLALPMGLQQDHISDGDAPSWRAGLSDAQASSLSKTLGPWLDKYGYPRHGEAPPEPTADRNGHP